MQNTICYYHLMGKESTVMVEGAGDCSICTSDTGNEYCKNYIPINIIIIEIKERRCLKLLNRIES
uniref:Uncharacterized protein n=1 Tax=viral metagenome TaxID=1070528 RepID=A0A6M3JXD1_9ZZZZ